MNKSNNVLMPKKKNADRVSNIFSTTLSWLFSLVFFALIIFITISSIDGFKHYGSSIFGSTFDLSNSKASVWLPLAITLIISLLAIIIAGPIGIKVALFIKYRLPKKYQKSSRVTIEILANIPSVIFGLFAAQSLGSVIKTIFGLETSYNVITAGFMLTFMILPTIVSLSLNSLDGVDSILISSGMGLGNTKTRTIYKICKKDARNGITVSIIIAFARAIGETMAVSMILQSQQYNGIFGSGFLGTITSDLRTLGALISANMFAEGGGPDLQSLLFAFGLFMFVFVMILNSIVLYTTNRKRNRKYTKWTKVETKIGEFVYFVPQQIKILWEKITFKSKISSTKNPSKYFANRIRENKFVYVYTWWKIFWEYFAITLTSIFLIWIVGDILIYGIAALSQGSSTIFEFSKDTTGQAFVNTLLIIVVAIGIGLPLSLFIAIYLNEFAKENKIKKTLLFFIDSLGATPSIIFGMFGLVFFIQTLGLSNNGTQGKSLIAGALTILIVILPTFIRTIQQTLQAVPKELRTNSYALGAGKWETIRKIVLPAAKQGITTSVVLSIGRILAETAPLYLTSGLSSSSGSALDSAGQTLTTRIYAQIYTGNTTDGVHIMYECALVTMILVFAIIVIVHVIIPYYFKWRLKRLTNNKKHKSKPLNYSKNK